MEAKKISVVINTYNASEHLAEVLESVSGFDEIVVCDMESTDDTRRIAESFGCRVLIFPKGNHSIPEPARDFANHSATYPWVLVVDADELIPEALRDYLYGFIESPGDAAGLFIPRKNYHFNRFLRSSYPDYQLRFFRKDQSYWPPTVHSVVQIEGRVDKIPASREDLAMTHIGASLFSIWEKTNLYTTNEVNKRRGEKVTMLKLMFSPALRFFKTYILKGGVRYGKVGFIHAQRNAIYKFMTLSKLYEEENRRKMGR